MNGLYEKSPGRLREIPVEFIERARSQPRVNFTDREMDELCQSIRQVGIIQPLTVRYCSGSYELIAGERRLRAAKMLNMRCVPCIIIDADEENSALITLVENLQRKDLDFFEEASGIAYIMRKMCLTQEEVANKIGKSQSAVANKLRLLRLPHNVREVIWKYNLTERHARALLTISDEATLLEAVKQAGEKSLSVEQFEEYILRLRIDGEKTKKKKSTMTGFCRDIRLYVNTISKAVKLMRSSGINASFEKEESENSITYKITIINQ